MSRRTFVHVVVLSLLVAFFSLTAYLTSAQSTPLSSAVQGLRDRYPHLTDEEIATVEAVKRVRPAVVSVVVRKEVFGPTEQLLDLGNGMRIVVPGQLKSQGKQVISQGSGFVVRADGLIMTNKHVVSDTKADYQVVFYDGKSYDAQVIARDPVNDLALLKIGGTSAGGDFTPVIFGNSDELVIGQSVIAIGNALGEYQNTVTKGVVSAVNRQVVAGDRVAGMSERLSKIIQTDAAINPGNSGGPLLNTSGEVVGINTAVRVGAENIGFAIPANEASFVLKNYEANGTIVRPYLGIRYVPVNSAIQKKFGLPKSFGVRISRGSSASEPAIVAGGPAAAAGLAEGDVILYADGIKMTADHDILAVIRDHAVGDKVALRVWGASAKRERTVMITLAAMPAP